MSFLGLSGPPTPENAFLQNVDIAVARNAARDVILRNRVRHLRGMSGLGATGPYRQGTRAWWTWYATVYLPQYYGQAKIQQIVLQSPYYQQFGTPFGYTPSQPYYYQPNPTPYYQQYPQNYQYPYQTYGYGGYGSSYYDQAQAQYTQWLSEQGSLTCQQQGGYWDYGQQACTAIGQSGGYNASSGVPPNVVGIPEALAISTLNSAGYNVWELSVDGQSRGVPPGYSANRVSISVNNGVVSAQAIG